MSRIWIVLLAALVALPGLGRAWELDLGVGTRLAYDSNVFRTEDNEVGDFLWGVSPSVRLLNEETRSTFSLSYRPRYEAYLDPTVRNTWNHRATVNGSYLLNPRTRLFASNAFRYTDTGRDFGASDEGVPSDPELVRTKQLSNNFVAGIGRAFDSRMSGSLSASYGLRRFDSDRTSDNDSLGINGSLSYGINSRNSIGGGVNARFTHFDGQERLDYLNSTRSQTLQAFLSYDFTWDDELSFSFSGGPVAVYQQQNTAVLCGLTQIPGVVFCPGIDEARPIRDCLPFFLVPPIPQCLVSARLDSDGVTFFARASVDKRWGRFATSLSYTRDQTTGGGSSSLRTVDALIGRITWDVTKDWTLVVRGEASFRNNFTQDVNAAADVGDVTIGRVSASLSRRIAKRFTLHLDGAWRYQDRDATTFRDGRPAQPGGRFDVFTAGVKLKFDLDPIRF